MPFGYTYGFIRYTNGTVKQFQALGSPNTQINDRNSYGVNVGSFLDGSGHNRHGFILSGSKLTQVDYPHSSYTYLAGINDFGTIAGDFIDTQGNFQGFVLSHGKFHPVEYPGATSTFLSGVNNLGVVTGTYYDGKKDHGFVYAKRQYHAFPIPVSFGSPDVSLGGIDNQGEIVVQVQPATGFPSSFIYHNLQLEMVSWPDAYFVELTGIKWQSTVVGSALFNDGFHGFVATCKP